MKKQFTLLLLFVLISAFSLSGAQANDRSEIISIPVTYTTSYSTADSCSWAFDYCDDWFSAPADVYSHDLARISLGFALSSFRGVSEQEDAMIRSFLTQAGFSDLKSEDYNLETERDTIATMIARKTLPFGKTLLAVGIAGAGYQNEWLGNLDIGDGIDHLGFSEASEKIVSRIKAYIDEYGIAGECSIWISGFSRAAAITNLTAASLMAEGLFNEQNAYVYTFASPNTTKQPIPYANIFNIIGKFDPATKLPYREWGYARHGISLYTPAQETDSDYRQKKKKADSIFFEICGTPFWNDPKVNHHFIVISEYLLSIIPTSALYHENMRDEVARVWENPDISSFNALLDALVQVESEDDLADLEREQHISDLSEYLYGISYGIVTDRLFDQDAMKVAAQLLHEHDPSVYAAWLFSTDDPDDVFSDNLSYVKLYVDGNAEISLFDQKGGYVFGMTPDGSITEIPDNEDYLRRIRDIETRPQIYAERNGDVSILILPKDQGMPFVMKAFDDTPLVYYGVLYNVQDAAPSISSIRTINAQPEETYLAFSFTPDGVMRMQANDHIWGDCDLIATLAKDAHLLSSLFTLTLDNEIQVLFSVKTLIIIFFVVLLLIILLLLALLILIIRLIIRLIRRFSVSRRG